MEELEGQRNICRTTLRRAVEAENQVKDMKEKSSGLEGELLSFDVERDQLREDRRKVKISHFFSHPVASNRRIHRVSHMRYECFFYLKTSSTCYSVKIWPIR
jgi:hypothetical protein